jgi:hypothetical protein
MEMKEENLLDKLPVYTFDKCQRCGLPPVMPASLDRFTGKIDKCSSEFCKDLDNNIKSVLK